MENINPKFIAAIILAAILIATGMYYYHADYQAKPYQILRPIFFANEQPMLAFSQEGSSASPVGNATINITGQANYYLGAFSSKTLFVYDYPWDVKMNTNANGVFHFTLLKYGSFTLGFKAMGYKTTFTSITVLRGNSYQLNIYLHRATNYNVSGKTVNTTGFEVPFAGVEFISFFGNFTGNSGDTGNYSIMAQNGTYLVNTYKGGYGIFPKPQFLNITGNNIKNHKLVMNKTNSNVFYVSGQVRNKLGIPLPGVLVSGSRQFVNSSIQLPKVYTNATGYYIIPVPTGINVLSYSNVAYLNNNSGTLMVTTNITHNETMISKDPFTGGNGPSGLSFMPSFMLKQSSSYLSGNLSGVNFANYYSAGKLIGVNVINTFYQGNPNSGAFFKGMTGVIAADINGTIYYQSFSINNSGGILNVKSYFSGNFNLIVYFQGFNFSMITSNVPASSNIIVPLTPLPGQFFQINVNATNALNGNKLPYTNDTLQENGITVNSTTLTNSSTYYYFIDLKQNYSINLTVEINETGFNTGLTRAVVTSLNGRVTLSISPNITLKLSPLKSIGAGLSNISLRIPGLTFASLQKNLTDVTTSNIYNTGQSQYIANISNPGKGSIGYKFIIATEVNGALYSTVINFSKVMVLQLNFSGFYGGSFNFIIIGQFWKSHVLDFGFTPGQTVYGNSNTETFIARNLSNVNVSVVSKFALDFYKFSGTTTNYSVPELGAMMGNFSIPLNYTSVYKGTSGTFYNYSLPSNGIYNFSYYNSLYIKNVTAIKPTGSYGKINIFVKTYGIFVSAFTTSPISIQLGQVNVGLIGPLIHNVKGNPNYSFAILGANPDFFSPYYFTVNTSGHTYDMNPFYISSSRMIYLDNITNSSGVEELNLTPYHTTIYNNTSPTPSSQFILDNMSFWNTTYVSGVIEKGTPFNILQGNYLQINGNIYPPSTPTSNQINNINYYYGSPTTGLSISLQINNGQALELIAYYGYYYIQESGNSISE